LEEIIDAALDNNAPATPTTEGIVARDHETHIPGVDNPPAIVRIDDGTSPVTERDASNNR
jgi:hypothetical protein